MVVLTVLLYALIVVISLLLIGLILIQPSKSGGMGAAFGGIGESVFGGKAGSHLTKTTVVLTAVFFVIALFLAAIIGHGGNVTTSESSLQEKLAASSEKTAATAEKAAETPAKAEKK